MSNTPHAGVPVGPGRCFPGIATIARTRPISFHESLKTDVFPSVSADATVGKVLEVLSVRPGWTLVAEQLLVPGPVGCNVRRWFWLPLEELSFES